MCFIAITLYFYRRILLHKLWNSNGLTSMTNFLCMGDNSWAMRWFFCRVCDDSWTVLSCCWCCEWLIMQNKLPCILWWKLCCCIESHQGRFNENRQSVYSKITNIHFNINWWFVNIKCECWGRIGTRIGTSCLKLPQTTPSTNVRE